MFRNRVILFHPLIHNPRSVLMPRRNSSPRSSKGSPRKTRLQLSRASEEFVTAVIGHSNNIVTFQLLTQYFDACNIFYCRNGDGVAAAKSCLQTIHNASTPDAAAAAIDTTTCTREQLTAYFLSTLSRDEKRIDRMAPLIQGMLSDQHRNAREENQETISTPTSTSSTTTTATAAIPSSPSNSITTNDDGLNDRKKSVEHVTNAAEVIKKKLNIFFL